MGPAIMIIGLVLMIVIHEGGHFVAAKMFGMKATEAFFGFGPKIWSTTKGETEYGVKAIPFGGYVRIIGMNPFEEIDEDEEHRTYRVAPFWKKTVVVLAGILSHFVVALALLWFVGTMWGTVAFNDDGSVVRTTTIAAVSETLPGSSEPTPAALAGTMADDTIIAADGDPITSWDDFSDFAEANGGNDVVITVERDGQTIDLFATLVVIEKPLVMDGQIVLDDDGEPVMREAGFFGITPTPGRDYPGPFGMIPVAIGQFSEAVVQSLSGLWQLIIGFPSVVLSLFGGNDEILETVRPISPIGLVQLAGPAESTLQLLALVNIFVGVLNFVPLYPLDGGHFAVAAYEKITGKEPNVQKLLPLAAVVFVFIVSLGLMGVYLDIFRPIQ
ncbi:MAG: hypothetical protein GWP18_01375 [Proteobacteria bacterium]|nr:hypothetical protein [Pseudomonadota bacterium]